jgi:hypothetical protein
MTSELHNPVAAAHVATVDFRSGLRLRRLATKALDAVPLQNYRRHSRLGNFN